MATRRTGLTLAEALATLVVMGAAAGFLLYVLSLPPVDARRVRCRSSLSKLARCMAVYLSDYGDNRFYPCPLGRGRSGSGYNGAEWLASLYWCGIGPDPDIYLCASSSDDNARGRDLGGTRAGPRFGSQTVSYAAMHWTSTSATGAPLRDDFPPDQPMASDDTQGTINHGPYRDPGVNVVFFDSHVEFRTHAQVHTVTGVGAHWRRIPLRLPRPLLWRLRN